MYYLQEDVEQYGLHELMDYKMNLEGVLNSHVFSMEAMGKGNIFA